MTEDQAVAAARKECQRLKLPRNLETVSAERSIVEHVPDRQIPGVPTDRIAWVVEFANAEGMAWVHVDDQSGEILEVIRTA